MIERKIEDIHETPTDWWQQMTETENGQIIGVYFNVLPKHSSIVLTVYKNRTTGERMGVFRPTRRPQETVGEWNKRWERYVEDAKKVNNPDWEIFDPNFG